jgi:ribonucleotide monophosphatase NagD (HAD superfamily)
MDKIITYAKHFAAIKGSFKPIVVTDIDGVLLRGTVPIPGTHQAVLNLKK